MEFSNQVAQAKLTLVWMEGLPMKWGSGMEMGRHVPQLGMSQQHLTLSRTPGMFGECQILNCEISERDKVKS